MEFHGDPLTIDATPHIGYIQAFSWFKNPTNERLGLYLPEKSVDGLALANHDFLKSLLPRGKVAQLEKMVLHPLLDLQDEFTQQDKSLRVLYRGSQVPIAYAPPESRVGQLAHDKDLTKLMDSVNAAIPELFSVLGMSPSVFRQNVDLDIEVNGPAELEIVTAKLAAIPGIKMHRLRPFLNQFSLPDIPEVFINVVNMTTSGTSEDLSELAVPINVDGTCYGTITNRRFGVSSKMDDCKAFLIRDRNGNISTILRNLDKRGLNAIDTLYTDPSLQIGQLLANIARNGRFLGFTLADGDLESAFILGTNKTEPLKAIKARLTQPSDIDGITESERPVPDFFDRVTFIGNNLVLLLHNPKEFARHQAGRPYMFAASRYYNVTNLETPHVNALVEAAKTKSLDVMMNVIQMLGMTTKNAESHSLDDVTKQLIKKVAAVRGQAVPELRSDFEKAAEKSQSSFTVRSIESMIKLMVLFDQWNPLTLEPNSIDMTKLIGEEEDPELQIWTRNINTYIYFLLNGEIDSLAKNEKFMSLT